LERNTKLRKKTTELNTTVKWSHLHSNHCLSD